MQSKEIEVQVENEMADKFIRDIAAYEAAGEQARKKAAEMEGIQAEAVVSLRATTHRTALSSVASTARSATARCCLSARPRVNFITTIRRDPPPVPSSSQAVEAEQKRMDGQLVTQTADAVKWAAALNNVFKSLSIDLETLGVQVSAGQGTGGIQAVVVAA